MKVSSASPVSVPKASPATPVRAALAPRFDAVLLRARAVLLASTAAAFAVFALPGATLAQQAAVPPPPSVLFGDLYARVQTEHLFPDSKTFADAAPRKPPADILADYQRNTPRTKAALEAFVRAAFIIPDGIGTPLPQRIRDKNVPLQAHIAALWPVLTRKPSAPPPGSSLLPLNWSYIVPGGRFREMYYWDSYFTMLGLVRDGQSQAVLDMTRNFADLIGRYGHIPNGTRTYYLSRSQPPFFYQMVGLTAGADATDETRAAAYQTFLPALRAEHDYWMHGAGQLQPGQAVEHVVQLKDGTILNRYWDASDTPRDESYREDVQLAATAQRPAAELYRDIRASAESGWDFSSRWFADGHSLATIETTSIIPVDLNSLLFGLERAIAEGCEHAHDARCVDEFEHRAAARRIGIDRYLWDDAGGRYLDYHWKRGERLDRPSAAMLYALFAGVATAEQAQSVAAAVGKTLVAPGGLLPTAQRTGQQWDAPNGWAPHQWVAVAGLRAYGQDELARTIATRWMATVSRTYSENGKLLEKYDVQMSAPGGGGEYPLQDGFGWTNGVTRAFMDLYGERGTK